MATEHKARIILEYLEKEEPVLRNLKQFLEGQLMSLQVQAVNLNKAYNDLKMKNEKMRIGKEIKKEPELKVESISPKQMTNFKTETLQFEPLHLDSASTIKSDNQLPELHLEPINLNSFSEFEMDLDEILQLAP
ncbi:uncharacterized protein LOC129969623 [Argiope bruennichi]|uniref:uncharacterized protein LOC129969623 n=1 Tax=Argiope bruennichi TaxID=94029 RepID=UPI002495766A|nr:uncharacterized protein LOC129969623 [Argiope bruennichi]